MCALIASGASSGRSITASNCVDACQPFSPWYTTAGRIGGSRPASTSFRSISPSQIRVM